MASPYSVRCTARLPAHGAAVHEHIRGTINAQTVGELLLVVDLLQRRGIVDRRSQRDRIEPGLAGELHEVIDVGGLVQIRPAVLQPAPPS